MECEICFDEFNRCERLPKVLQKCGHTFCETCVSQMVKMNNIECPFCRYKIAIGKEEYPPNNFALLNAMDNIKDEREGKGISKYYKPMYQVTQSLISSNSKKRDIYEYIQRQHSPFFLRLNSILDNGEALYQETNMDQIRELSEQDNPALVRQNSQLRYSKVSQSQVVVLNKNVTRWRYSYHQKSIFSRWFDMRLGLTYNLFVFKKHYSCQHKYGCVENLLRKGFKTVGWFMIGSAALSLLFALDIKQELISLLKDNWEPARGLSQDQADLAYFGLQTFLTGGMVLWQTAGCWKNMLLDSSSSDTASDAKDKKDNEGEDSS